ncbi:MAG: hypothetical protein RLY31_3009 [Bacteroidota bacterium]|jgi:hypothetical protein
MALSRYGAGVYFREGAAEKVWITWCGVQFGDHTSQVLPRFHFVFDGHDGGEIQVGDSSVPHEFRLERHVGDHGGVPLPGAVEDTDAGIVLRVGEGDGLDMAIGAGNAVVNGQPGGVEQFFSEFEPFPGDRIVFDRVLETRKVIRANQPVGVGVRCRGVRTASCSSQPARIVKAMDLVIWDRMDNGFRQRPEDSVTGRWT